MIGGQPIAYLPAGFVSQPSFVPPGGFSSAPAGFHAGAAPLAFPQQRQAAAGLPPPPARFPGSAPPILARAKVDEEAAPRPQSLTLPTPEQLGVARSQVVTLPTPEHLGVARRSLPVR